MIDLANLSGIGIGAVLLALVFRTFWKQEGGWRAVLTASRDDAASARADALALRADVTAAREAERRCLDRLGQLERRLEALELDRERRDRDHDRDRERRRGNLPRGGE